MHTTSLAQHDLVETTRIPDRVEDRKLAALDLAGLVVSVVMALGPLTVYAIFGS